MIEQLPMFPLNNGIVPGALLPLRLFEPRYLEMLEHCLEGSGEFGVVLIARGSEVGGGDHRYDVGTLARIAGTRILDDGTTLVLARGETRMRVVEWLPDDPYPQANIERLPEPDDARLDPENRTELDAVFETGSALLTELGVDLGSNRTLPDDDAAAIYHALALLPVAAIDRQQAMEIDDLDRRAVATISAINDVNELTRLQLSSE